MSEKHLFLKKNFHFLWKKFDAGINKYVSVFNIFTRTQTVSPSGEARTRNPPPRLCERLPPTDFRASSRVYYERSVVRSYYERYYSLRTLLIPVAHAVSSLCFSFHSIDERFQNAVVGAADVAEGIQAGAKYSTPDTGRPSSVHRVSRLLPAQNVKKYWTARGKTNEWNENSLRPTELNTVTRQTCPGLEVFQ